MKPDDIVLEIGSGKGALTKYLENRSRNIIAVEIDKNNCGFLQESFHGLKILHENFLRIDPESVLKTVRKKTGKLRVIGNIPYNITTPILFKLIDNRKFINDFQLLMQEEVAQRLTAVPDTKDYGILSVLTQTYTKPKLLFKVSRNCFYPKPKVDSRIVSFNFTDEYASAIENEDFYRKFIRASFSTRRKTLRNSLKNLGIKFDEKEFDFDFSRRAENLSVKEFIDLSNTVYRGIHTSQRSDRT